MKLCISHVATSAVFVVAFAIAVEPGGAHSGRLKSALRGDVHLHAGRVVQSGTMEEFGRINRTSRHHLLATEQCGVTKQTTSKSQRGTNCPASCPLYVKDKSDSLFCSFQCVPDTIAACKAKNPNTPVPDTETGSCRECSVSGCRDCATDGTDTCFTCKGGKYMSEGKCYDSYAYIKYIIGGVLGVLVIFIALWIVSLARREVTNQEGLERGLNTRSAAKLLMPLDPEDPDEVQEFWPMTTNLLREPVAGPGITHLFNFQFLIIVWAAGVLLAWTIMAYAVDTDFFILGTKEPGHTPRDNCIIVAWGFETQERLMVAKYTFVYVLYMVSFVGLMVYSVFQLRRHQVLDAERASHKDYCALVTGLPELSGTDHVEHELRLFFDKETQQKVLGVSICWNFEDKEDLLMQVINHDNEELESKLNEGLGDKQAPANGGESLPKEMSWVDRIFARWESALLSPDVQKPIKTCHAKHGPHNDKMRTRTMEQKLDDGLSPREEIDIVSELEQLRSTDDAFIVFESEGARDAAVKAATDKGGIMYKGSMLQLYEAPCEPQNVNWSKMVSRTWKEIVCRVAIGFGVVVLALLVWCFVFYLPYARLVVKSDYAHGKDPNVLAKTAFGFIVVAGNVVMYLVCAEVSDRVGFKTHGKREVCYMLLYCFACVVNVVLDLVMGYKTAYAEMVGTGVQTHNGEPLSEVDSLVDRFDTYAMQKSLGQVLFSYSFPSTFLIPFLIEPLAVITIPYQLMCLVVRTNPAILGSAADAYLASTPMDLSRYADVLLNVMLAVLMFFFPGGYITYIFAGLIVSHCVIYAYDHYRMLRSIPACDFSTMEVEWWAQWLLSIPCGLLLACAVFKANCQEGAEHCWEDTAVIQWCALLFIGHIILHTLVLRFLVPLFGVETAAGVVPYKTCAAEFPTSWFAANPVHCLRSKYILEHNPPCDFHVLGKGHLLRQNFAMHLYYVAKPPKKENFETAQMVKDAARKMGISFSHEFSEVRSKLSKHFDKKQEEESTRRATITVEELEESERVAGAASSDQPVEAAAAKARAAEKNLSM